MPETLTPAEIRELVSNLRDFDQVNLDPWGTMEEAADALEWLLQFVEWKPIEDAPRDSTEILTHCDLDGPRHCIVVSFEENDENPKWPWWDWDCKGIHESVPTHFVPLPPPPIQEKETTE
jgi:hypothetical protein